MIRYRVILFVSVLGFSSCDYLNDSPIHLVGKTYLWSEGGGNRKSLYYKTGESTYSGIDVSGTVTTALANDSLIYVKCGFQQFPAWHLIKHESGEKIISLKNIDSADFIKFEKGKTFKYSYYSK